MRFYSPMIFTRTRFRRKPSNSPQKIRSFIASHSFTGWLIFRTMACVGTNPACAATCRQASLLLVLALVPALLTAWLHPKRPAWSWTRPSVTEIALADAVRLTPVIWVDARPDEEYAAQHMPGALSLNEDRWNELIKKFLDVWSAQPGARVVVYCNSQRCDASRAVAVRLRHEYQIGNVFVLQGGWAAWLEAQKK
jgi:rhodanese-related sulfurtransferase